MNWTKAFWKELLYLLQLKIGSVRPSGAGIYISTRLFVHLSQSYLPLYLQKTLKMKSTYGAIIPFVHMLPLLHDDEASEQESREKAQLPAGGSAGSIHGHLGLLWLHSGGYRDAEWGSLAFWKYVSEPRGYSLLACLPNVKMGNKMVIKQIMKKSFKNDILPVKFRIVLFLFS